MKPRLTVAMLSMVLLGACTERLPPPALNADAILALRAFAMEPAAVEAFSAAGEAAANDRGISVRLGTFRPPGNGSWAEYLETTLRQQLEGSGRYKAASALRIGGVITENRSREGKSSLSVRFTVSRGGRLVYDRVQRVESSWNSSFVGFLAYERALGSYTSMYPQVVSKLFDDAEFRAAVAPAAASR